MSTKQYPEWEKLKSLLVGDEKKMIESVISRLDNFNIQSEELCELLPESIRRSMQKGNKLTQAFIPLLNETFKQSIEQDPNELNSTLYALIGPATRKSVSEALKSMLQSFNTAMQNTFSWQGLKWRFEALVSSNSFSEVVLLHTLIFQVEQVFLIHKKTGILLESAKLESAFSKDADMVSSMLRAIQDFVHDSFQLDDTESLNTLNIGELTVWIQECPEAVLAFVIRGNAPETMRTNFSKAIENFHTQYKSEFKKFDGDTEPFEYLKPELESLLLQKTTDNNKDKKPIIAIVILSIIAILLLTWAVWSIWDSCKWSGFKDELASTPGFFIIDDGSKDGKKYIRGFKDEFANYPDSLWQNNGYDSSDVLLLFEPYSSQIPTLVEKRAKKILDAPESVSIKYNQEVLFIEGTAPKYWLDNVLDRASLISGVRKINTKKLNISDGFLIDSLIDQIESTDLFYQFNSTKLVDGQQPKVNNLLELMKNLINIANSSKITIEIMGHSCSSGSEQRNLKLSWNRAKEFLEYVSTNGLNEADFLIKGFSNAALSDKESSEEEKMKNRKVSFNVIINKP